MKSTPEIALQSAFPSAFAFQYPARLAERVDHLVSMTVRTGQ
ncbi:MAG TPA: hypothetical protein VL049_12250 [Candidatus Dormibacteraeota bacterium]|nr:hypothetical protein [Candidatus Dormibacteraeota bacterium]